MTIKHYRSIQEKKRIVKAIRFRPPGYSIRSLCKRFKIDPHQYRNWNIQYPDLEAAPQTSNKTLCKGAKSQYHDIEKDLLDFLFEINECDLPVTTDLVVMKAADLKPELAEKSDEAQQKIARRFLKKHEFSRRRCTRQTKKNAKETEAKALDFVSFMKEKMTGPHRDKRFILNMDQTPVLYCQHKGFVLETQ
jgi:hypothetical protein